MDVVIIPIGNLVACIEVVHADLNAVLIGGKQQINVAVIELHGIVEARQQLEIADDLGTVSVISDGNGGFRFAVGHGDSAGLECVQIAVVINPRNGSVRGGTGGSCRNKACDDVAFCHIQLRLSRQRRQRNAADEQDKTEKQRQCFDNGFVFHVASTPV